MSSKQIETQKKQETVKKKYDHVVLDKRGTLIISKEVQEQIVALHRLVGSKEWSGILIYDVEGSPLDPKTFKCIAKHIHLMDIGSGGYTEYEPDGEDMVSLFDEYPDAMELKTGHIHTHHNMSAFFSGTDTGELEDNVDKHNYYLSLIVNFSQEYVAKVAMLSEVETTRKVSMVSDNGKTVNKSFKQKSERMIIIDMDIEVEQSVSDSFIKRYNTVKDKVSKKHSFYGKTGYQQGKLGWEYPYGGYGGGYDSYYGYNNYNTNPNAKRNVTVYNINPTELDKLTWGIITDEYVDPESPYNSVITAIEFIYKEMLEMKMDIEEETMEDMFGNTIIEDAFNVIYGFFDKPPTEDQYATILNKVHDNIISKIKYSKDLKKFGEILAKFVLNALYYELEEEETAIVKR